MLIAESCLLIALLGCASVLTTVAPPPTPPEAAAVATARPPVPARARYHYLVAQTAIVRHDWDAAESALRTALLHDPDSPWLWLSLADVAKGRQDAAEERNRAHEALRCGPDLADALARAGEVDLAAGDTATGTDELRRAVAAGADDATWSLLARTLVQADAPDAKEVVAAWAARPLDDADLLRDRGHARVQTGDLAGAVDDLGEVLTRSPSDARLLDEYVTAVTGSGRYRRGLAQLDLVHRLAPADTDVLLRTWHLAAAVHDPVRAADALTALDAASNGADPHVKLWLADALSSLGRHDAALAALADAGRCRPPLPDLAYHRARLLRAAGRKAEALATLRVPESGSNRGEALALRARLLIETGHAAEGRRAAEEAAAKLPDDYAVLGALVAACAAEGDRAGVLAAIDRMAMLDDEARARTRARTLASLGDVDGALMALNATKLAEPETWIVGGTVLREARRPDDAVAFLQRGVDRFPAEAGLRAELGLALDARGAPDDALVAMREALRIDPTERTAVRYYAAAVVGAGAPDRLAQVRGWLLATLERNPADPELLDVLGQVEVGLAAPLRAVAAWEEALRYAPADADVRSRLATVYREVGRPELADALTTPPRGRRR